MVEGLKAKRKRTHGHGQQRDDYWEEGSRKRLSGNGKNTLKIKLKKKELEKKKYHEKKLYYYNFCYAPSTIK